MDKKDFLMALQAGNKLTCDTIYPDYLELEPSDMKVYDKGDNFVSKFSKFEEEKDKTVFTPWKIWFGEYHNFCCECGGRHFMSIATHPNIFECTTCGHPDHKVKCNDCNTHKGKFSYYYSWKDKKKVVYLCQECLTEYINSEKLIKKPLP